MGLFNKLFSQNTDTTEQVVEPTSPVLIPTARVEDVRIGMWVLTDEGVGILTDNDEVTLVKEDGTTKMVLVEDVAVPHKVTVTTITQATIEQIPVSRRGSTEFMYSLGYRTENVQWP